MPVLFVLSIGEPTAADEDDGVAEGLSVRGHPRGLFVCGSKEFWQSYSLVILISAYKIAFKSTTSLFTHLAIP